MPTEDWPNFRGPAHNGISSETLPATPDFENTAWRAQVGIGFSSVAVAEGRLYTMGHAGGNETVFCFDAGTGNPVWKDTYEAPLIDRFYEGGPGATPTVRSGRLYTCSKHGHLHCYDAATGARLWTRDMMKEAGMSEPPEWGFASSPCFVTDDLLLIEAGSTFALDPATGDVLWKGEDFTPAYSTPVTFEAQGRTLAAVMKSEGLVILDAADGKAVATAPWETDFHTSATTPIVDGNRIFISTGYDRGYALFELNGSRLTRRYENALMSNDMNNCVLVDGYLFGFDGTAHKGRPTEFVCLEFATGAEKWRVPKSSGLDCGSLMAVDGGKTLLVLTERGELLTAPAYPAAFEENHRTQILGGRCWTVPVLADGHIYARNAEGDLVAIDLTP